MSFHQDQYHIEISDNNALKKSNSNVLLLIVNHCSYLQNLVNFHFRTKLYFTYIMILQCLYFHEFHVYSKTSHEYLEMNKKIN